MCGANVQAFDTYESFVWQNVTSVGIFYEVPKKEIVGEGKFLKGFLICALLTHKIAAVITKMAAW